MSSTKTKTTKTKTAKPKTTKPKTKKAKVGGVASKNAKTEVQSVLFDNKKFSTRQADSWLSSHGFKRTGMEKTTNNIRFRQTSPKRYGKFATKEITPGVKFVFGIK